MIHALGGNNFTKEEIQMAKQNYNQMSTKPKDEKSKKVDKTSIDTSVLKTTVNEPEKTVHKKNLIGHVFNCEMLNIRSKPIIDAEILIVVNKGTKVEIHEDLSTDEFYSVKAYCPDNITVVGYVMKEYVELES